MKTSKKILRSLIVLYLTFFSFSSIAQNNNTEYPVIGKPCPEFTLNEVEYYSKKNVSLADFKGKWLILDFLFKNCSGCFASFPKINQFQKNFKNDIQFILIAQNDQKYNKDIRNIYEKFRKKQNLELTIAYDSVLSNRFGIKSVPHIVIIDQKGEVYAVTASLNNENLRELVNGKRPAFLKRMNVFEEDASRENRLDTGKPLLINGNGGADLSFLYRSLLSKWSPDLRQFIFDRIDYQVEKGYFQVTGLSLTWLYNYAYIGSPTWLFSNTLYKQFSRFPILEIKDSSLFQYDYDSGKGIYNYSLIVPKEKASSLFFQEVMQRRILKNYFGFEVVLEKRPVSCWKLIATDKAKINLKTKGGPSGFVGTPSAAGFSFVNIHVSNVLAIIQGYHQSEPMLVDDTDFKENIDITIDAIMTDLNDIKKALQKNGLDLVKGEKEMKCIVIRDPVKENK